jgi:hypothetical protein
MTTPLGLAERVTALEYAVFGQGDRLRMELLKARFHAEMSRIRDAMSMWPQTADGQFSHLSADTNQRFAAVDQRFDGLDTQLRELWADMDAKLDTILGELRKPSD